MPRTLYIENLPPNDGQAAVERLLRRFGPVRCTAAATDPDVLRRRPGMALVELETPARARAALRELDGTDYRGGTLRVRWAVAADAARVRWACRWDDPRHDESRLPRGAARAARGPPHARRRGRNRGLRRSAERSITMLDQIMTNKESELLLEVLASERRRLMPEIRRTDARHLRSELQARLRTIDRLIARFEQTREDARANATA